MTPSLSSLRNKIDLPEGQEVMVTILVQTDRETFQHSAGQWKGTLDAEALICNIYAGRDRVLIESR